jgi:hypothetical protein
MRGWMIGGLVVMQRVDDCLIGQGSPVHLLALERGGKHIIIVHTALYPPLNLIVARYHLVNCKRLARLEPPHNLHSNMAV